MKKNKVSSYKMYINGEWVCSSNGTRIDSFNPANGQPWASIPAAATEDVNRAVNSAKKAFPYWASLSHQERSKYLLKFVDILKQAETKKHIALIETTDWGRQIGNSIKAVENAIRYTEYFVHTPDNLNTNMHQVDNPSVFNFELRDPLGVIAAIIPWNSPTTNSIEKIIPAIIMGNTIVIKPSEFASCPLLELVKLLDRAGLPRGVVNVVTGSNEVGEALVSNSDIAKIAFTGSPNVAKKIARNASGNLTPCLFELGGKAPNIVFDDCDFESAVTGASVAFKNNGQVCYSPTRLLLQKSIYSKFLDALVEKCKKIKIGDPMDLTSEFGPLATIAQLEKTQQYINIGRKEGAREVLSAMQADLSNVNPNGYYIGPTIFADVDNNMQIAREEIFGPVLSVIPFETEKEAIKIANDTEYGLTAGIWTKDLDRANRVSRALQTGTVWINTYADSSIQVPYGGYKQSGLGRERGMAVLEEYSQKKQIVLKINNLNLIERDC